MFSLIELTVYVFHVSMCPMLNINESGTGMEDRARGASVLLDGPTSLRGNKDDKYTYFLLLCSSKRTNKQTSLHEQIFVPQAFEANASSSCGIFRLLADTSS